MLLLPCAWATTPDKPRYTMLVSAAASKRYQPATKYVQYIIDRQTGDILAPHLRYYASRNALIPPRADKNGATRRSRGGRTRRYGLRQA